VVILKDHKIDSQRFYYAGLILLSNLVSFILLMKSLGAFKPSNKMDSDVHIAEFFVFDSAETKSNFELKKVNVSHMQISDKKGANQDILQKMTACVEHYQFIILKDEKLPRVYKSITPTLPAVRSKMNKVSLPPHTDTETPIRPDRLQLEKSKIVYVF
jgi:hypothetical protein